MTGVDGDPKILGIARAKSKRVGVDIALEQAMAYALPHPEGSFDRVLSSLVFHHLTRADKARTFREVRRVLRAGGELHFADFGKPHNWLMLAASLPWRLFEGAGTTRDNVRGELPALLQEAGLAEVCETARYMTLFGTLSRATARGSSGSGLRGSLLPTTTGARGGGTPRTLHRVSWRGTPLRSAPVSGSARRREQG